MKSFWGACAAAALLWAPIPAAFAAAGSPDLPKYDHIVVVIGENKDFTQIIGNPTAPYLNKLAAQGVVLT
ncbi:MAG: hypothetical protein ACREFH_07450, partial [Stellaceae bacterium]